MDDVLKDLKDIIPILLFLLPGFLTTKVISLLAVRRESDSFDKVIQAFVFTFVNMLCFSVVRWILEHLSGLRFDRVDFYTTANLILMVSCSVGIGLACSWEINNEPLLKKLRSWGLTKKTYKPGVWMETFQHVERYVVVHLVDGRRVYGFPRFYSDRDGERSLFLENASWLNDQNDLLNQTRMSIFLDEKSGILLIEFVDFEN